MMRFLYYSLCLVLNGVLPLTHAPAAPAEGPAQPANAPTQRLPDPRDGIFVHHHDDAVVAPSTAYPADVPTYRQMSVISYQGSCPPSYSAPSQPECPVTVSSVRMVPAPAVTQASRPVAPSTERQASVWGDRPMTVLTTSRPAPGLAPRPSLVSIRASIAPNVRPSVVPNVRPSVLPSVCQAERPIAIAAPNGRLARVTAYWASEGDYFTRHGIASTGVRLHEGHCAVDPNIIPYGSVVDIPGIGKFLAVDTGTAVIERKAAREGGHTAAERNALVIDLYFESRRDGEEFASSAARWASVSWWTPSSTASQARQERSLFAEEDWTRIQNKL